MRKLKLTLAAAVLTFTGGLALAQSYTLFNYVRINSGLDARGAIENQTGDVTINDNLDVNGTLTASSFSLSGAALTRVDDTNVTLTLGGSPSTALVNAASLTLGWTGQLSVARGGTGAATLTGLLQGNGTSAVTAITNSSTVGQVLRVTGASTYAWGALDLADTDAVTGVLGVANGGLNLSTAPDDNVPVGSGATWQAKVVPDCDDSAGNHLNYDTTTNAFSCGTTGSGSASPGGADTQVQFNDAGAFGGDAGLVYNETTDALTVTGVVTAGGAVVDAGGGDDELSITTDTIAMNGTITGGSAGGVAMTPSTGTFTITFDVACTTSPTMQLRYNTMGNMVILTGDSSGDAFNCTSDSTGFSDSGTPVPAAIRPTIATVEIPVHAIDNGVYTAAVMLITTAGGVQINNCTTYGGSGNPCVAGWTSSGVKALNNISGAYNINN